MADFAILLADDEPTFREATAESFRGDGFACDVAADSPAALDLLAHRRYDVLIADIKMAGNTNLEFVQLAQSLAPHMAVILVTGYPSLATAIEAANSAIAAYLTKPFPYEELRAKVRAVLGVPSRTDVLARVVETLRSCLHELEQSLAARTRGGNGPPGESLHPVLAKLTACVGQITQYISSQQGAGTPNCCELAACPVWVGHRRALRRAVNILQETKARFKSKELATVREILEGILDNSP